MNKTNFPFPETGNISNGRFTVETVFFDFEEDFVEDNVRCIPMIVRFKLDACGIKLKLSEWSRMDVTERQLLSEMSCARKRETLQYRNYLQRLIFSRTGNIATVMIVEDHPAWIITNALPGILVEKLREFNWQLSIRQWRSLTKLQRFVLLKLCRPGHENKNFPIAMKEFGVV